MPNFHKEGLKEYLFNKSKYGKNQQKDFSKYDFDDNDDLPKNEPFDSYEE
jgi:hypothetical protein